MVELNTLPTAGEPAAACCAPEAQATCCEPSEKAGCCGSAAAGGTCGCPAGQATDARDIRETVREKYAAAARAAAASPSGPGCCSAGVDLTDATGAQVFRDALYAGQPLVVSARAAGRSGWT